MTIWTDALKEWNRGKGTWCIPRKGTDEHKEVRDIMDRLRGRRQPKAKPAPKKRGRPRKFEKKPEIVGFMEGGRPIRKPVRRRIRTLDVEPTQENIDMLEAKRDVLRQKIYKIVETKGRETKESNELKDELVFLGRKILELKKQMRGKPKVKQPQVEMKQEPVPEATSEPLEDMSQKDLEDNIQDLKEEVKELKDKAFRIVEMKGKETKESKRLMDEAKMLFREQIEYSKALKKKKGIKAPKISEAERKKRREADRKKALEDFEKRRKALLGKAPKTIRKVETKKKKPQVKPEEKKFKMNEEQVAKVLFIWSKENTECNDDEAITATSFSFGFGALSTLPHSLKNKEKYPSLLRETLDELNKRYEYTEYKKALLALPSATQKKLVEYSNKQRIQDRKPLCQIVNDALRQARREQTQSAVEAEQRLEARRNKPRKRRKTNKIRNPEELEEFYDNYNNFSSRRKQQSMLFRLERITDEKNFKGVKELLVTDKRWSDFFPTPEGCLDKVKNVIESAEHIFEPTAGLGSMIYKAYKINPNVKITANELLKVSSDFIKYQFPQVKVTNEDFLKMEVKKNDYDAILLNPPFTRGGDKKFYLNFLFKAIQFMNKFNKKAMPEMVFLSPPITEGRRGRGEKIGDSIDLNNLRNVSKKKKLELYNQFTGENKKKLKADEWEDFIYDLPISQFQVVDECKFQTTGVQVMVYLVIGK